MKIQKNQRKKQGKIVLNRKSQIKMGETIMVLLAFFILLMIGLVIYATYQKTSMKRTALEAFEREAVKIALKTAFYPEFACSEGGVINENCFDLYKLKAFKNKMEKDEQNIYLDESFFLFYETELRDSFICVEPIFPFPETPQEAEPNAGDGGAQENFLEECNGIILYDNRPDVEKEGNWENVPTFIPITLRDDTKEKARRDSLGMLIIEVFRPLS